MSEPNERDGAPEGAPGSGQVEPPRPRAASVPPPVPVAARPATIPPPAGSPLPRAMTPPGVPLAPRTSTMPPPVPGAGRAASAPLDLSSFRSTPGTPPPPAQPTPVRPESEPLLTLAALDAPLDAAPTAPPTLPTPPTVPVAATPAPPPIPTTARTTPPPVPRTLDPVPSPIIQAPRPTPSPFAGASPPLPRRPTVRAPTPPPVPQQKFEVAGSRSALVGRAIELAALDAALSRAAEYKAPQVVTLLGNQGTGKSRLLAEWSKAQVSPVRVLHARALAGGPRYGALGSLLRSRFGLEGGDDGEAARARFKLAIEHAFGDHRVDEVVHFLGSFMELRLPGSPFLRAFEDNPRQYDDIACAVFRRFLEVDAAGAPLVLCFDDLHLADDDTLQALEDAAESLAGSPIVILAAARPELLVRRPRWCARAGEHTRLELRNLEDAEAAALFRQLLQRAGEVPEELVWDAVEQTGGNPFFLEELVRLFLTNGTIDTSGPRWQIDADAAASTELPISVEEAIAARIDALAPDERALLEKGAIFGNVFWLSAVVALSRSEAAAQPGAKPGPAAWSEDGLRAQVERKIDALVDRDYLLRMPPEDSSVAGDVEVVFKHNLERELVLKLIDAERARRLYRIAAQWLDTKLAERNEEQLEFLAQLFERGGDQRRAATCNIAAGDKARARFANEAAVGFYQRGLSLLESDESIQRLDALHNLGDVLGLIGRTEEATARFEEMLRAAWLLDHQAKGGAALGRLGRLLRQRGEYDRALGCFQTALELFQHTDDRRGVAGALDDMGQVHWRRGAFAVALEHHRQALAIRRALGDKRSIALCLANIGRVHHDSGSFKAAIEQFREALEIRREIGDRAGVITSLCDVGGVHEADGSLDAAFEFYSEALRVAREIGDKLGRALVLGRLGGVELSRARLIEARGYLGEALEIAASLGDRLGLAEGSRRLAEVLLALGDLGTAREHARRSLDLAEKLGSSPHRGAALRCLGEITAASPGGTTQPDERQRAEQYFRAAIETLASLKHELELARCYRAFAAFCERTGAQADAVKLRMRADEIFGRLRGAASEQG